MLRGCHGITISGDQEIFRETRLIKGLKEIQWKEIKDTMTVVRNVQEYIL